LNFKNISIFKFKTAQNSKNLDFFCSSFEFQTRNYVTCFGRICNHPHGQENYTQKYINTVLITVLGHIIKVSELSRRVLSLFYF